MSLLIPVCTPHQKLLERLRGRRLVLRIKSLGLINEAVVLSQQCGVQVHCLIVAGSAPLEDCDFAQEHRGIPVALFAPNLGRFRDLAPKLRILRDLNIRIYLPLDREENFGGLRILSSLGVPSAAVFHNGCIDWEKAADLMTYALLGRFRHAPIEPFQYLAEHYSGSQRDDFSAVYFNDATRYVHIDEEGHIALSSQDLEDQRFISAQLKDLDSLIENDEYRERVEIWRRFFLQAEGCAYCEAWRICLGKFNEFRDANDGCSAFFKEFLEVIEQYQILKTRKMQPWQP